jgi:hypothetical protein
MQCSTATARTERGQAEIIGMNASAGDQITVESEKAGSPPRIGEILEVLEAPYGTSYHVRWEDGHETTIHPFAGTVRIRHPARVGRAGRKATS